MVRILERRAASIGEILKHVKAIARKWTPSRSEPEELWFRGQSQRQYPLVPTIYRDQICGISYDEDSLFLRFKALAVPFVVREPSDDWDWYFLARHHGLPSRLLDWSQSLLAAVFFALSESLTSLPTRIEFDDRLARGKQSPIYDDKSPTIWVLDAGTLNQSTCGPEDNYPFFPGGEFTSKYLPENLSATRTEENRLPIALFPPLANARIVAQQGRFTLHGHSAASLESLLDCPPSRCALNLARIVLDGANTVFLLEELTIAGVDQLGLFPDLDSVAEHVRWKSQRKSPVA